MAGNRTLKILTLVLVSLLGLLASALVAAWLLVPGIVLSRIEGEALRRGVKLSGCQLGLGWPTLTLSRCQFEFEHAKEVSGTVERIEIVMQGMAPASVAVQRADAIVRGMPDFDRLFEQRKRTLDPLLPVALTDSSVSLQLSDSGPPAAKVTALTFHAPGGDFAGNIDVAGLFLGTVSKAAETIQVELSPIAEPGAKIQVRMGQDAALGELRIELKEVSLARVAAGGVPLPLELLGVTLDSQVYAQIPIGLNPTPAKGDARFTMRGLNFPVPRELAGLVYGTPAEVTTNFTLDRSFTKGELKKLTFKVGALDMRGSGKVALDGLALNFELTLNGRLSCDAIVRSAVAAHAGTELSRVAGIIAKRALQGSVDVYARISGSTAALDKVSVIKTVGVGCGIKPFPLDGLPLDGIPDPDELLGRLRGLPGDLEQRLPKGTEPTLPGSPLPKLPSLPDLLGPKKDRERHAVEPQPSKPQPSKPQPPKSATDKSTP